MTYKLKMGYQDKAIAATYLDKRFSHPRGKKENEETLSALGQAVNTASGTKSILDMPCGNGRLTSLFCERGYLYVGADVSMEMLEVLAVGEKKNGWMPPLVRCEGEALPFKDNAFDCVACFRFFNVQRIPKGIREAILKEMGRISKEWLILQGKDLKFQGPFVRLKVFLRKLFGGNIEKYEFEKELLAAGWSEKARVRIQTVNRYVGVYRKAAQAGRVKLGD